MNQEVVPYSAFIIKKKIHDDDEIQNSYNIPVAEELPTLHHILGKDENNGENASEIIMTAELLDWFSHKEIDLLLQKPMPISLFRPDFRNVDSEGYISLTPFLYPPDNMPQNVYNYSLAKARYGKFEDFSRFRRGIRSTDPSLNSQEEILNFIHTYNTRPIVHLYCELANESMESNGISTQLDWYQTIDITKYVFPFGKLYISDGRPIEALIDDFLQEKNRMKTLKVKKILDDQNLLMNIKKRVRHHILNRLRVSGFSASRLTVEIRVSNTSITIARNRTANLFHSLVLMMTRKRRSPILSKFKLIGQEEDIYHLVKSQLNFPDQPESVPAEARDYFEYQSSSNTRV